MPLKLYNGYENFSLTLSEVFLASIKEEQQTKPFFNYSDSEEMMDVDANFIKIYANGENNSEGWEAIFSTILIAPYIFVGTLSDENITLIGYGQTIYALDQKTGKLLWNFKGYELKEIITDKDNHAIYVHDETDVYKLTFDGKELWKYPHHEIIVQITLDKDTVILHDFNDKTYKIEAKTGRIQ